ncbi:hypothetical protein ACFPYN_03100 [Paenisporosarcina macmurdoensis]|uniref:Tail fiber protein n=1 Tax=Paenisporosarcina macmurdoensis TaxID=212659 RepID=A0ABW1L350_9BACL
MQFLTNIDLGRNELQNARIQNLGAFPTSPVTGMIFYHTTNSAFYGYDGTAWQNMSLIFNNKAILDAISAAFTTAMETKLIGIATNANNYVHPSSHPPSMIVQDASNRFMTDAERSKLAGVATGATNYTHPASHPATMITGLATVATSGTYASLSGLPILGTAASKNTGTASGTIPILDSGGKLDVSVLPSTAISDTFIVTTEVNMLALTVQVGDIAVRTDISKSFILRALPSTTLTNWQELLTPVSAVQSVAGKTGVVTLTKSDVGLSSVDNVQQATKVEFNAHTVDVGNPHQVNKGQIGLGFVENYGMATLEEGNLGSTELKYMNPYTTKQAVLANAPVRTVAGKVGLVVLDKADVGLNLVDNVKQATKTEFDAHNNDAARHVTTTERNTWNSKPDKTMVNIGNGTNTSFVINHSLNSQDVIVMIREMVAPFNVVYADVAITSASSITVSFASAPTANQYRATIIG